MSDEDLRAEIARLRAGEADTPPPEGATPTPAQWIRSWNDLSAEQRLKWAEHILGNADQAYRCFAMDHEGRIEELEAARHRNPPPTSQGEHLDLRDIQSIAAQIAMRRRKRPPAGTQDGEARS